MCRARAPHPSSCTLMCTHAFRLLLHATTPSPLCAVHACISNPRPLRMIHPGRSVSPLTVQSLPGSLRRMNGTASRRGHPQAYLQRRRRTQRTQCVTGTQRPSYDGMHAVVQAHSTALHLFRLRCLFTLHWSKSSSCHGHTVPNESMPISLASPTPLSDPATTPADALQARRSPVPWLPSHAKSMPTSHGHAAVLRHPRAHRAHAPADPPCVPTCGRPTTPDMPWPL